MIFEILNKQDIDAEPKKTYLKMELEEDGSSAIISVCDSKGNALCGGVIASIRQGGLHATYGLDPRLGFFMRDGHILVL